MEERSFESLLRLAITGDHDAFEKLLNLYMPLINKNSYVDGQFDEDCKQYIMIQIALEISRFKI